jgi:hypothetical protein
MLNLFKTSSNTERFTALFGAPNTLKPAYSNTVGTVKTVKDQQVNFRTDKATKVILETEAKARGLTVSALVHQVLSTSLKG